MSNYQYYNKPGGRYFYDFIIRNAEFNTKDFTEFVIGRNRGDRDSGELDDIAKHEVLRLAHEWEEKKWRFPNVFGAPKQ